MNHVISRRTGLATLICGAVLAQAAVAAEVAGIRFDDRTSLAGHELQLNGLGLRTKLFVKIYAAGLYLPEPARDVATILRLDGPRRVTLVFLRDVGAEEFGTAFMQGLDQNLNEMEKSRLATHIAASGAVFAGLSDLKKGDVIHLDWLPGRGTVYELNGKKLMAPIPDLAYYNAMLGIWLGGRPIDAKLKPLLIGRK